MILLFDHTTGTPIALLDAQAITALRTAAISGLATRLLARADVRSHGIFGTGIQAVTHIDAIKAARPAIDRILVWDVRRKRPWHSRMSSRGAVDYPWFLRRRKRSRLVIWYPQ